MRFIHTADWHLGRIFFNVHLTADQAYILDRFTELVKDARPDFVAIAGDIYDRAVPPREAVELLDETLSRLVLGLGTPVVLIAGNHDSPERLGFASRLLAERGLHVAGALSREPGRISFEDRSGPVYVYAIPYSEPPTVRERLGFEDIADHDGSFRALTDLVRSGHPDGVRSVLLAHAFAAGGEGCESERPLTVGGSGMVSPGCFAGFDYVALGHLHRPQSVAETVHYSGSLLKYSFSEAGHRKSVSVVEMDGQGRCAVERVPLPPKRDVRFLEGTLAEIRARAAGDDYLMITLLDREPILNVMDKLRDVYPNTLHIERTWSAVSGDVRGVNGDHRRLGDADLFAAFFAQVAGEPLSEEQRNAYVTIVDRLRREEREAGA
ncbi:MAG: exonuclease SbcCD subunit D [Candidatus Latescibacterota bacterium]